MKEAGGLSERGQREVCVRLEASWATGREGQGWLGDIGLGAVARKVGIVSSPTAAFSLPHFAWLTSKPPPESACSLIAHSCFRSGEFVFPFVFVIESLILAKEGFVGTVITSRPGPS